MSFSKKRILKLAKGYWSRSKNCIHLARARVEKAYLHQYMDRRKKKRDYRKLFIIQINAATREYGIPYSKFVNGLKKDNIWLDRRMLAELAINEPFSFKAIVDQVKFMRGLSGRCSPYDEESQDQSTEEQEDLDEAYAYAAQQAKIQLGQ